MLTQKRHYNISILLNASAQTEEGCVNFRQHAPQISCRKNVLWASRHHQNLLLWSRLIRLYVLIVWRRSIQALWWKHRNERILAQCAPTHPCKWSTMSQRLLDWSCTLFLAVVWMLKRNNRLCGIPIRCKMPAQTIKAGYANLSSSRATKLVAIATFLDRS